MTTTDLLVNAHTVGVVTSLAVRGELDIASVDAVRVVAERAAYEPTCGVLRIDLAGVSFCDLSGLELLIEIGRLCNGRGVDLVLERPSRRVRRVIELTGLRGVFQIES